MALEFVTNSLTQGCENYVMTVLFLRTQLTTLHHNENAIRDRKMNKDGKDRTRIKRKKATSLMPTVYYEKLPPSYGKYEFYYAALQDH